MIDKRRNLIGLLLLALLPSAISAADNDVAVGATPAIFDVDQQGGAVYRIPLAVPLGPGRMQPSLALVYNSHTGDGPLGVGWSLEGTSVIHRCASIRPVHGYRRQVEMDDRDALCIDGRFLMPVDGAELPLYSEELRTYIESFTRISRSGPDSGFVTWTRDGWRMTYGDDVNARIRSSDGNVFAWLISRIADRIGNVIDIEYVGGDNERYISRINYGTSTLSFEYAPRIGLSTAYLAGVPLPMTQRLTRIVSRTGGRLVREYRLGYEDSNDVFPDRLGSLTECGADGSCLRPGTFDWEPLPAFGFSRWGDIVHTGSSSGEYRLYRPGDFNGDGLTDVYEIQGAGVDYGTIWLNRDGVFTDVTGPRTEVSRGDDPDDFYFADFNGDGLTDVYRFRYRSAYDDLYLTQLSGEELSFEAVNGINSGVSGSPTISGSCVHRACLRFGDFNGDGRVDVYRIRHNGTKELTDEVHLSNGDGTYEIVPGIDSAADHNEERARAQLSRIRLGDFNGDGMIDIYRIGDAGRNTRGSIYLTTGNGRYRRIDTPVNYFNSRKDGVEQLLRIQLGDFNGDGLTDIYYATPGGHATQDEVHLSRGDGTYTLISAPAAAEYSGKEGLRASLMRIRFGDFNGDGKTDIYHMAAATGRDRFYLSTGNAWRRYEGGDAVLQGSFSDWIKSIGRTHLHDFNGDGATDVYRVEDPEEGLARIYVVRKRNNLIRSFSDGLGAGWQVNYAPLSLSSVHTLAGDTAPGAVRRPPFLQVVSEVRRRGSELRESQLMRYRYGEARSDLPGFGFSGFAWKETHDPGRQLIIREVYSQQFPHFGSIVERRVTNDQRQIISAETTEYEALRLNHGKTVFPRAVRSVSQRYEPDGSLVSAVTTSFSDYDEHGNVGEVQTITESAGRRFTHTERNEYVNDERRWILGLRVRARVTASDDQGSDISRSMEFSYDPETGLPLSESVDPDAPLAVVNRYEYDAFGNRVVEITEAIHQPEPPIVTLRTYDEHGRFPVKTINAEGHVTTYVHDDRFARPLVSIDANGLATVRRYDGWGRLLGESHPGSVQMTIARTYKLPEDASPGSVYMVVEQVSGRPLRRKLHDAHGQVLSIRTVGFDGEELFENRVYDDYGRLVRISLPSATAEPTDWVEREYDALDRLVKERSPLADGTSVERRFTYDGLEVTHIDELGRSKTIERDALGRIVRIAEPTGAGISFEHDPVGRVTEVTDASGGATTMEYDVFGNRLRIVHPDRGEQRFDYDPFGRAIRIVDATGVERRMAYDRLGRLLKRVEEEGTARWFYDGSEYGVGKLSSETYGDYKRSFFYDDTGRLSLIDDSRGYAIGMRHDQGRIEELHYPGGGVVRYSYNPHGYLSAVSSPFFETGNLGGKSGFGKMPTEELYQNKLEEYQNLSTVYRSWIARLETSSKEAGLIKVLDEAARALERGVRKLRRTVSIGERVPTVAYCEATLPLKLARISGLLKDAGVFSALLHDRTFIDERLERGMHARLALSDYMLGETDKCLPMIRSATGQDDAAGSDIYYWRALAQDSAGRVVLERTGDGWETRRRYHSGNGYLQEIQSDFEGLSGVRHLLYHYDEADNLLSRIDVARETSEYFAYDDLDRLVHSVMIGDGDHSELTSYRYDESGNLIFRSGVDDDEYGAEDALPHAASADGGSGYEYDESGNFLNGPRLSAGWFSFGKPMFLESIDGERIDFTYDANGNRLLKRSSNGDRKSYFGKFYEQVHKADGSIEHFYYIYAGDKLVAVRYDRQENGRGSRKLFYLHQDSLGSVDTITDESGVAVSRLGYTPFGAFRADEDAVSPGVVDRGFTGHEYLKEVDLIHMNGRIYDPHTGRFLSPDPYVSLPLSTQSHNRYGYALNNPTKFTDPSGFFLKSIFKGIKRAVTGLTSFIGDNFQTIAGVAAGYYAGTWATNSFVNSAVSKLVWSPGGMWSGAYMGAYNGALSSGALLGGAVSGGVSSALSGGNLRGVIANTVSGGVLGKIAMSTQGQWSGRRVLSSAAVNGVAAEFSGGRFQDAALSSLKWGSLRYAAGKMRQAMVAQSLINPANASGQSAGLWGDGFKLGGRRHNVFDNAPSVFGGHQGGEGQLFGVAYAPGSLWDRIVEAYAGPHDYFNNFYWYDQQGNIDSRLSPLQRNFGEALDIATLFVATPFAAASLLPDHVF